MENNQNGFWRSLFTARGRIDRGRFWRVIGLLWLAMILCLVIVTILDFMVGVAALIVVGPFVLAGLVAALFNQIKRLHDLGRSSWWILPFTVITAPFSLLEGAGGGLGALASFIVLVLSLLWIVVLGAFEGQRGPNRFGEPPWRPVAAEQPD